MATLTTSLEIPFNSQEDWNEYDHRVNTTIQQVCEDLKVTRKGDMVGEIIRFQIAFASSCGASFARYMVASEKPLKLMHINEGDGYQVSPILIRGLILSDVKDMVKRERAMREAGRTPFPRI